MLLYLHERVLIIKAYATKLTSGADPQFLKRVFICIKVSGSLCGFYLIFLKYRMKMKLFGLTETKLFHFHGIFKKQRVERGIQANPLSRLWIRLRTWTCFYLPGCESLQKLDLTVNFVGELTSLESLKDLCFFRELYVSPLALVCLFDLILYVPSTIFQLNRDGSSWVEPVLSQDKCVLLKDHNAVMLVRLKPAAPRSWVKHSITEPLHSTISFWRLELNLCKMATLKKTENWLSRWIMA